MISGTDICVLTHSPHRAISRRHRSNGATFASLLSARPILMFFLQRRPVDLAALPRNHAAMEFEDASPRMRPSDLLAQLVREDLDPLSVAELDERIGILMAEIDRTRAKKERAVNHKASAEALFKK